MIALAGSAVTVMATTALLAAERVGSRLRMAWKPLASIGFLVVAVSGGIPDATTGRLILGGLVCSFVGDVALLGRSNGSFLAGLGAFLLAHLFYAGAFWVAGQAILPAGAAGAVFIGALVIIGRWLLPHVSASMRGPVVAYMAAITAMVVLSVGAVGSGAPGRLMIGALLFYLSDLAVARQQFVTPGFVNRAWGLPVYYVAQLILASTV